MLSRPAIFPIAATLFAATTAAAQVAGDMFGTMSPSAQNYMLQSSAMQSQLIFTQRMMQDRYRASPPNRQTLTPQSMRRTVQPTLPPPVSRSKRVDSHIANDTAASARIRQQFLSRFSPRVARGLNAAFTPDIRTRFSGMMGSFAGKPDDLIDVTAAYLATMWMTANGRTTMPDTYWRGLKAQVEGTLSDTTGPLRSATERQAVAETMMYQSVTTIVLNGYARDHGGNAREIADAIDRNLKGSGFALRTMTMSSAGLAFGR